MMLPTVEVETLDILRVQLPTAAAEFGQFRREKDILQVCKLRPGGRRSCNEGGSGRYKRRGVGWSRRAFETMR